MEIKKYIVFADGSAKIFSAHEIHSWVAGDRAVLSAGRCWVEDGELRVAGESTTLGVRSRPEDAEILKALAARTEEGDYKRGN